MARCLALLLLLFPMLLRGQSLTPEAALERFAKYPQERLYLQYDKAEYLAGETVHFKAWAFVRMGLSPISTNLYFECMDADKKPVFKAVFPLVGGVANGSFALPEDLPENIYYCRAFTGWMLNFEERYQHLQPLVVYNPRSPKRLAENPSAWQATLHPESGVLLDGVMNKVAIRLHTNAALYANWTATLTDVAEPSKTLVQTSSYNPEIGQFSFIPASGKKYNLTITDAFGKTQTIPLPTVQQQGAVVQTSKVYKGINYQIFSKGLPRHLHDYRLLAHVQGRVLFNGVVSGDKDEVSGFIPLDAAARGVLHLTLFDAAGAVAAERLVFAEGENALSLRGDVNAAKLAALPRQPNEWTINTDSVRPDAFVVGVWSGDALPAQGFLSTYWLNGIAQPAYNPDYCFSSEDKNAVAALDALLISEKWNLFDWKQLQQSGQPPMRYFPDSYLSYEGTAQRRGKPVSKDSVTLMFQLRDSTRIFQTVKTDSAGRFHLKRLYFQDTARVYYHVTEKQNAAIRIDLSLRREETFPVYSLPLPATPYTLVPRTRTDSVPRRIREYVTAQAFTKAVNGPQKTLDTVVVKAKGLSPTQQLNRQLSSGMFMSPSEYVLDFVNEQQDVSISLLDYLTTKIPGLTLEGGNALIQGQIAQFFIDEMPDDGSMIQAIPVVQIAMVRVIRHNYFVGKGAPVIALYLKRGNLYEPSPPPKPHIPYVKVVGYPMVETLATLNEENAVMAGGKDSRSLLYWNADASSVNGKATIRFFNNDQPGAVRVMILGFSKAGLPVYLNREVGM